jgi:hypothetical protein
MPAVQHPSNTTKQLACRHAPSLRPQHLTNSTMCLKSIVQQPQDYKVNYRSSRSCCSSNSMHSIRLGKRTHHAHAHSHAQPIDKHPHTHAHHISAPLARHQTYGLSAFVRHDRCAAWQWRREHTCTACVPPTLPGHIPCVWHIRIHRWC